MAGWVVTIPPRQGPSSLFLARAVGPSGGGGVKLPSAADLNANVRGGSKPSHYPTMKVGATPARDRADHWNWGTADVAVLDLGGFPCHRTG